MSVSRILHNMAAVYQSTGRPAEALKLYQQSAARYTARRAIARMRR